MKLKTYLADMNMTIKDFGIIIDHNPGYLSHIITGRSRPSKKLVKLIAKVTGGKVRARDFGIEIKRKV